MQNTTMNFDLSTTHLRQLCALQSFEIPNDKVIIIGIRGCLPQQPDVHTFGSSLPLTLTPITYDQPRCTLGIWDLVNDQLSVYPGSTIPSRKYLQNVDPNHFNQLIPGKFKGWKRGIHNLNKPSSAHEAFRNEEKLPVIRTFDDRNFDSADRIFTNKAPNDNIHATYSMKLEGRFDSAGCQVVLGLPKVNGRRLQNKGPWKHFKAAIDHLAPDQKAFGYLLFRGHHVQAITDPAQNPPKTLRYGSTGPSVATLQTALNQNGAQLRVDSDFGFNTLHAVIAYQTKTFGPLTADGVIGPNTAKSLGIVL
jgi:Putative peptidoglycan binding domain